MDTKNLLRQKTIKRLKKYFANTQKFPTKGLQYYCACPNKINTEDEKFSNNLPQLRDERTVSFWFRTFDSCESQGIIGFSDKCKYSFLGLSFKNTFIIRRSTENYRRYNYTFRNNTWYHVTVFIKGDYIDDIFDSKLWVNGNEIRDINSTFKNSASVAWDNIFSDTHYSFNGDIADIRVYNRQLSDIEISALSKENITDTEYKLNTLDIKGIELEKQNTKEAFVEY